jgi:hypothetical protein
MNDMCDIDYLHFQCLKIPHSLWVGCYFSCYNNKRNHDFAIEVLTSLVAYFTKGYAQTTLKHQSQTHSEN